MKYDFCRIESKWIRRWDKERTHRVDLIDAEKPFYNLMMFPYPSAEGLHVGNLFAFIGGDVQGRYHRARGYDVFEPMGFDAFGIHSENHAIRAGGHPAEMIPKNIRRFREQLGRIAAMFDWSHQVTTTDPSYYRWTQWIFVKLFEAGLAYRKEAPVNWCPSCSTVLADEQAAGGVCERCGTETERRGMRQWFFRITACAERLLENLERIDWPETTKRMQRRWIGRSEGAEIFFPLAGSDRRITVFTTRSDTLWGVTYLALAPDHPDAESVTKPCGREALRRFVKYAAELRDGRNERSERPADREAAPGFFSGSYALHPATGRRLPVWISPYVLSTHGSGAVMGVPAHDRRDGLFAEAHGIPVEKVIELEGEGGVKAGEGTLVGSGPFTGMPSPRARERITEWLAERGRGKAKVAYRLHDWCISRQRYWGPPIPMIHCPSCGTVPVPVGDLPVLLPDIRDYRPDGSGLSPLARRSDFLSTHCPNCGGEARRDADVSDNFLDSAWYFLRYPSAGRAEAAFDPELTAKWLPVDMYVGGNEHAVLHLLYTRFITMVLHDLGHLSFEEPFKRFRSHGLLVRGGAKMSKSRGNVVNPDRYLDAWGADTLRTYLLFFSNFQEGGDFRDEGIEGVWRFLNRIWRYVNEGGFSDEAVSGKLAALVHGAVRKVTEDIERLHYNTAIAAAMELFNGMLEAPQRPRRAVTVLLRLLAPFAPCIAHELWERLGEEGMIMEAGWPDYDAAALEPGSVQFVFQVNGRIRDRMRVPAGAAREEMERRALSSDRVRRYTESRRVRRIVFVRDKLVNIVVE